MKTHQNHNMVPTTRLAALGLAVVLGAGAVEGVSGIAHKIDKSNEIADHIKNPASIPVSERVDVVVPTGSNASNLSKDLAPDSKSDQASLYGELSNQMQNGALEGTVHLDKSLVEVHPTDVNFLNPSTGQIIHPPKGN